MLIGWANYIRQLFTKKTDFVSVDARRFSNSPRNYEMISSAPPRTADSTIKVPEAVVTSPPSKTEYDGISPLAQSPRSRSSQYTDSADYFSKGFEDYSTSTFGMDAEYKSPKLSFSTPRPPSAGRPFSRENAGNIQRRFSPQMDPSTLQRSSPGVQIVPMHAFQRGDRERSFSRSFSPNLEWDPQSTHAKSSTRQGTF